METSAPLELGCPLCVDLDGTLVKSDTLVDSLLVLVRSHPADLLRLPGWLLGGKARLKQEVTARVQLSVEHLPYNRKLLEYLMAEHGSGRRLYLATGADGALAARIARHLGIFDGVLASDGTTNFTGNNKLAGFHSRFGTEFDYIGNARPDLPLLGAARNPMLANPDLALRCLLRLRKLPTARTFEDRGAAPRVFFKAIRVHQWAKNILIFLPLLLAHHLSAPAVTAALLAFIAFSLCASGTYIINDLLDIESDRQHPRKRNRAFASGNLSASAGLGIVVLFLATAFTLAHFLPPQFLFWLCFYLITTLAYSLALKRVVILDVVVLASLYTLRMLAGAAATSVMFSPWLAAFSIFIFLSLAMVKRFSELQNVRDAGSRISNGRGYLLNDIEQVRSFGTSSAFASVVVFAIYIGQPEVSGLYHHHQRMWLITPLMILWLCRVWLLASRGELDEDPVVFAITDPMSMLMGLGAVLIALAAA